MRNIGLAGVSRRKFTADRPNVLWVADVGSGEAPIEGLASARRSNGSCSFPASRFHEWAFVI